MNQEQKSKEHKNKAQIIQESRTLSGLDYITKCHIEAAMEQYASQQREQPWVRVEEQKPTEEDGLLLVANGNFTEIVWLEDSEGRFQKPMRYDDHDNPVFRSLDQITHWRKLPTPPIDKPLGKEDFNDIANGREDAQGGMREPTTQEIQEMAEEEYLMSDNSNRYKRVSFIKGIFSMIKLSRIHVTTRTP